MKIFLDSNIFLSAAVFPRGRVRSLYDALADGEHELVASGYVLDEVERVAAAKFPKAVSSVELFIRIWHDNGLTVTTPAEAGGDEARVRDEKDKPVLRAARAAKVGVLLTGDADLLEAGIDDPEVMDAGALRARLGID